MLRDDRRAHSDTTSFSSSGIFRYQTLVWHYRKVTWYFGSHLDVIVNGSELCIAIPMLISHMKMAWRRCHLLSASSVLFRPAHNKAITNNTTGYTVKRGNKVKSLLTKGK